MVTMRKKLLVLALITIGSIGMAQPEIKSWSDLKIAKLSTFDSSKNNRKGSNDPAYLSKLTVPTQLGLAKAGLFYIFYMMIYRCR